MSSRIDARSRAGFSRGTRPESLLQPGRGRSWCGARAEWLLRSADDPGALRRAIEYLLDRPDERARLGAAGRRTMERLADLDQYVRRLSALVEEAA